MLKQTRNLVIFLAIAALGLFLHIISLATPGWILLELPEPLYRNGSDKWMLEAHSGLWQTCRTEKRNITDEAESRSTICESLSLFQSRHNLKNHPEVDSGYLDYRITSAAFSLVGLVLMILGLLFGIYSLKNPRYMFKRLTAFLFVMCAVSVLVCIEVLMTSNAHAAARLPGRVPTGSHLRYGYSFYLGWIVFVAYILAAGKFLISSRKQKGENAPTVEMAVANEPLELGR